MIKESSQEEKVKLIGEEKVDLGTVKVLGK
jgi:hypothetical protein